MKVIIVLFSLAFTSDLSIVVAPIFFPVAIDLAPSTVKAYILLKSNLHLSKVCVRPEYKSVARVVPFSTTTLANSFTIVKSLSTHE
ncbi:hypothetical protein NPIL_64561 [Nephila pilipes]|uniref:Uncharacterized protein n=1 Tax=Nephila pilipes TaxID=299642 RepID=A0A8X6TF86_NEPPI|nr:hypothetical protein NPIL_64561 [Nephila pilipes]